MRKSSPMEMKKILHRYFELWRTQDVSRLKEIFTKDAIYAVDPFEESYRGIKKIERYWLANTVAN